MYTSQEVKPLSFIQTYIEIRGFISAQANQFKRFNLEVDPFTLDTITSLGILGSLGYSHQ